MQWNRRTLIEVAILLACLLGWMTIPVVLKHFHYDRYHPLSGHSQDDGK